MFFLSFLSFRYESLKPTREKNGEENIYSVIFPEQNVCLQLWIAFHCGQRVFLHEDSVFSCIWIGKDSSLAL